MRHLKRADIKCAIPCNQLQEKNFAVFNNVFSHFSGSSYTNEYSCKDSSRIVACINTQ